MTESSSPQSRLLLVDGHYYLYRSFFAIRGLTNSRGEPVNAIYGFVKALRRMIADLKPDYAAVVWDAGLPERRTLLQPQYKQHRDEMPDDLEDSRRERLNFERRDVQYLLRVALDAVARG